MNKLQNRLRGYGPLIIAVVAALLLLLWMTSGDISTAQNDREDIWQDPEARPSRVQVETLVAQLYQPEVVLQGQVAPWQQVMVRARVAGDVEALPKALGASVARGDRLLTLSDDARESELAQARAELNRSEADLRGAETLRGRDLSSEAELLRLKADVARAQSDVTRAQRALADREPRAPFAGVIDRREVELGDYVRPGDPLMHLVDVSRLKVTAQVPQQKVGRLALGQQIRVGLLNGTELSGELTFIASAADSETRAFRLEATLDNPDQLRIAGGSATLRIAQEPRLATRISPAYLSLGDNGRLAVKYVDNADQVQEAAIELLSADNHGAWIDGLPLETRIITQGAGFVRPGDTVEAIHGNGDH
ncbi:MAG: efflux RND transporter periplasmic adaptor subunit [Halomonadaceae bacterium]|nr:MAG: efflux RND transporter periplasmic adaptor subunit [Halomonadaceae bacterium]